MTIKDPTIFELAEVSVRFKMQEECKAPVYRKLEIKI